MAQFKTYKKNIEVNPFLLSPYIATHIKGSEKRIAILEKYGIKFDPNIWYPQQLLLDCFRDISENLGEMNLFLIGHTMMKEMSIKNINMKEAIETLNIIYHQNHKLDGVIMYNVEDNSFINGAGAYIVSDYNPITKNMTVLSSTPFSTKSDEGAIFGILEHVKPINSILKISVDPTKERRTLGGDTCTYNITW